MDRRFDQTMGFCNRHGLSNILSYTPNEVGAITQLSVDLSGLITQDLFAFSLNPPLTSESIQQQTAVLRGEQVHV